MNSIRCRQCKHFIIANVGEGKIYGCDRSKCVFEPITKNSLEIDMAIKIIKADSLAPYSVDDILKARDLAVEALKQMRTVKNNLGVDCISRESVLELLNDYRDKHFENRKEYPVNYGTLLDILRWIRNLPSVTPQLSVPEVTALAEWTTKLTEANKAAYSQGYADGMKAQEPIKALGEELRKARKGITDEKVLIGYNMAVAICNKYLGESEE